MEKYGFIYIWFDKKNKRYYIGRRWGNINDGYICSSQWMKSAIKSRPNDFKRKILKTNISSKQELRKEEYKYLSLIESHEFGTKYYNLKNNALGYRPKETYNGHTEETKQKISKTKKQNPTKYWQGKRRSEETKQKISKTKKQNPSIQTKKHKEKNSNKIKELWKDPVWRKNMLEARKRGKEKRANV